MFRKKKQDNQESSGKDSTGESTVVVHDKPLICLFDFDDEIVKNFTDKSYRYTEGTIGKLVRVPNNGEWRGMGVGPQQHIEIIYKTLKFCVK